MATSDGQRGELRELDHRRSNGVDVSLLWDEHDNSVVVSVVDASTGSSFDLEVPPESARHVFHHPFAHAGLRGLRRRPLPPAA